MNSQKKLIVVLGPTASGKTKIGVKLSAEFNGEIISADSRQVYQGMDIGSGKDLAEYNFKIFDFKRKKYRTGKIPYHLIDVVSPRQKFDLAKFQKMAFQAMEKIYQKKKIPFLVGVWFQKRLWIFFIIIHGQETLGSLEVL